MNTETSEPLPHAARWRQKLLRLAVVWGVCLVAGVWTWHLASWPWALIPYGLALIVRVLLPGVPRNREPDSVAAKILWLVAVMLVFWAPPVRALTRGLGDRLWTLDSLQLTIGLSCLVLVHVLRYVQWLRTAPLGGLLAYYDGAETSAPAGK